MLLFQATQDLVSWMEISVRIFLVSWSQVAIPTCSLHCGTSSSPSRPKDDPGGLPGHQFQMALEQVSQGNSAVYETHYSSKRMESRFLLLQCLLINYTLLHDSSFTISTHVLWEWKLLFSPEENPGRLPACSPQSLFTKDKKASRPLPVADWTLINWPLGLSVSWNCSFRL